MYGLGCRERQIYAYLVPQFLCLIVATGILGCWGSVRLYDRVVFWMLQGNIRPFDDAFSALSTAGGSVDEVMQYLSLPTDAFVGVMMLQCVILLAIFALAALIFVLRRYDRR